MRSLSQLRRGQALLMVLALLALLGSFVLCATIVLRPAGQTLDLQMALDQAQCSADVALEQALANLEAGKPIAVEIIDGANSLGRADGKRLDDQAEITATGRAAAPQPDYGKAACAMAQVRITVAKGKSGRWRVKEYVVAPSRLEALP
jgi:hypothetical protein